jgi:hypothetical protein
MEFARGAPLERVVLRWHGRIRQELPAILGHDRAGTGRR